MHLHDAALPQYGAKTDALAPKQPANSGILANIGTTIAQVLPTAVSVINQQRLANLNFERIRRGEDPVSYEQLPGLVPTAQVGIEPQTRTLMLVLGGAAVFMLLMLMRKRGTP